MSLVNIQNISKIMNQVLAVNNVSLDINENEIFCLLGSNGAGKTTLINMLTGLLLPDKGSISILGWDVVRDNKKIKPHLSLVPQNISLYQDLTVLENMQFFGGIYVENMSKLNSRIKEIVQILQLEKVINRRINQLSGGYQRRCSLGCALIPNPKLIILDEPLVGIDIYTCEMILQFIKSIKNTTVILTTHSINEAESIADHVAFMDQGEKVLDGSPQKLIKDFSKRFGEKIIIDVNSPQQTTVIQQYLVAKQNIDSQAININNCTITLHSTHIGGEVINFV